MTAARALRGLVLRIGVVVGCGGIFGAKVDAGDLLLTIFDDRR